jgi:site-specific recombinase XerD
LIARIGNRAGIKRVPVRPHIIRHTLNIIRRRAKIDPVTRSRLLTHTNLNSLHHYEHALDGELAAAREQQREGLREYLQQYLSDYVPRLSAAPSETLPKSLK